MNNQNKVKRFICLICNRVANNPVEIICGVHNNQPLIAGKYCLSTHLQNNNGKCPVGNHDGCNYHQSQTLQNQINEFDVLCLTQFEQYILDIADEKKEKENRNVCGFKGKIGNMNTHLINSCPLNKSDCWFKGFGCDYSCQKKYLEEHLINDMERHFGLVMTEFKKMRTIINKQQIELGTMQEKFKKLSDEILMLKQQKDNIFYQIQQVKQEIKINESEELKIDCNENNGNTQLLQSNTFNFDLFQSSAKLINTLSGHTDYVCNIDYSVFDDCQLICSGSSDKTVRVWDVDNNKQIQSFNGHSGYVCCAKFSQYHNNNNQNVICYSSYDKTIRFWDFKNNQQLQVFKEHTAAVYCVRCIDISLLQNDNKKNNNNK
ncbi:ribosome assembly protein 4 (RSA4), partial [Reticulomyxa filosa]